LKGVVEVEIELIEMVVEMKKWATVGIVDLIDIVLLGVNFLI
jgi:hypothetical protein